MCVCVCMLASEYIYIYVQGMSSGMYGVCIDFLLFFGIVCCANVNAS